MASNRLVGVLAFTIGIPVIGLGVSLWILSDFNSSLAEEGLPSFEILCGLSAVTADAQMRELCDELENIVLLRDVSLWVGVLGLGLPIFSYLGSVIAGENRSKLSAIFPHSSGRLSF